MHLGAGSGLLGGPSQKPVRNQSETNQKCSQKCSQKWPSYAVLYSRMEQHIFVSPYRRKLP